MKIELGEAYQPIEESYFRVCGTCSDNRIFFGNGLTPEEARRNALKLCEEWEAYLIKTPREQLQHIIEKNHIMNDDVVRAIKLIGHIILKGT